MIDQVFSPNFKRLLRRTPAGEPVDIDNIDRGLEELAVAGIYTLDRKPLVWIVGENENTGEKQTRLKLWLKWLLAESGEAAPPVATYLKPFEDPYINNSGDLRATAAKARLLAALKGCRDLIVITTLSALNLEIEDKSAHSEFFLKVDSRMEIGREEVIERLTDMGYRSRNIVEEKGDISWRGSIVDIFPIDRETPVRLEIEADTVISIRTFDPDTQKSLKRIESVIFPVSRFFLDYPSLSDYFADSRQNMHRLPDLLGDCRVVVSDRRKISDEFDKLLENYFQIYRAVYLENDKAGDKPEETVIKPPGELFGFRLDRVPHTGINETWDETATRAEWSKRPRGLMESNLEDIRMIEDHIRNRNMRLYIFSGRNTLSEKLHEQFSSFVHMPFDIPCSFENRATGSLFLAERNFQYVERIERVSQIKTDTLIRDITPGDPVVHKKHGIGTFTGFQRLQFEGHVTEFLKIEYFNKEFLYVPVYELDVLNKYVAFEGHSPKIDRLGGNSWAAKQKKARKSIILFARELLELYAMRKAIKGHSYTRDHDMEDTLGEGFQYVETEDQKKAIRDVLADLEADFPMDRLICGDVSFGKTEVALRAALRVVANGKQVAVLCPTTILAFQHFKTFSGRLENLPVTVAMLSRLVSPKEKKRVLSELEEGKIDIVIGTHSIIARDIQFKRLGLCVIDEEQRFGVFQKEKLKKNREDIDVLSMSATPIPRTLSFSLTGLQDISTIQTPPLGRLAIKNYVGYYSKEIIISAVLHELERDGLVFIVYNNIEQIYTFKDQLDRWLPQIDSVVIHAKMKTHEIEKNLMAFIDRKYRVLISTTIIENGIDIRDVNTLIVLDADRFGLTQLYQLRGRIGRGNRQAFAYFLVRSMSISDKAKARLDAIREFADLGSGYQLAEFDLKLRGAGSLLGNRQHGQIEALGFDYYHQMLVRTIKELKGELEKQTESKIDIHFSYSIDSTYIRSSSERIMVYRRILEAEAFGEIEELHNELEDRYGRMPDSVEKIFFAGAVRVLAKIWDVDAIEVYLDRIILQFRDTSALPDGKNRCLPKSIRVESLDNLTWVFHLGDYKLFTHELIECFRI